jgi:hypothetical protein
MATTLVAKEAKCLKLLLCDLGEESKEATLVAKAATVICCDNQSIIALTQNPKFHSRSKHIELQFHFI